ncbi:unnamed protein product, partial [Symbiodinium sp. KB8]
MARQAASASVVAASLAAHAVNLVAAVPKWETAATAVHVASMALDSARAALMAAMALEHEIGTDHFEIERSPIVLVAQRVAEIARGEFGAAPEVVEFLESETKACTDVSAKAKNWLESPPDAEPVTWPSEDIEKLKFEHQRFVRKTRGRAKKRTQAGALKRSREESSADKASSASGPAGSRNEQDNGNAKRMKRVELAGAFGDADTGIS